jgi:transcriptional regulator with XRE-family HTH domain
VGAVGRRLRELREFDTTQADLARRAQLSRYEKGKSEIGRGLAAPCPQVREVDGLGAYGEGR